MVESNVLTNLNMVSGLNPRFNRGESQWRYEMSHENNIQQDFGGDREYDQWEYDQQPTADTLSLGFYTKKNVKDWPIIGQGSSGRYDRRSSGKIINGTLS